MLRIAWSITASAHSARVSPNSSASFRAVPSLRWSTLYQPLRAMRSRKSVSSASLVVTRTLVPAGASRSQSLTGGSYSAREGTQPDPLGHHV